MLYMNTIVWMSVNVLIFIKCQTEQACAECEGDDDHECGICLMLYFFHLD